MDNIKFNITDWNDLEVNYEDEDDSDSNATRRQICIFKSFKLHTFFLRRNSKSMEKQSCR